MGDTQSQPSPEPAEVAHSGPTSLAYRPVLQWLAENFYLCGGCTLPCQLLHELYIETCNPDFKIQIHPSTFGKLIQIVFPGLVTRKKKIAKSVRYHYDGIAIKKESSFYVRFCCLLYEQNYLSNSWSSENAVDYKKNREKEGTSKNSEYYPSMIYLKAEQETFQYLFPEFNQFFLGEQVQSETDPYKTSQIGLLANDYYNYCQVILQMVRESKLEKVEDCIMTFWMSLQPERIELMYLPDVCQLLKSYDRYLFKELENILLPDFLEEVPAQHIHSIRSFSENVEHWMLNTLKGFPLLLQTSKSYEVKEFVKRIRRQTDLCNMAKAARALLNNTSTVTALRAGLHAVFSEQSLNMTNILCQDKFRNPKKRQKNVVFKCLKNLISLLTSSTDIQDLLSGFSSDLQTFVIKPSKSKEAFEKQASDFMLKWNLLLSTVGEILTINRTDSFGMVGILQVKLCSIHTEETQLLQEMCDRQCVQPDAVKECFHLFCCSLNTFTRMNNRSSSFSDTDRSWLLLNLLLVDFAAHIFQTHIEENKDGNSLVSKQNEAPVLCVYEPSHLAPYFAEDQPQANAPQTVLVMQNQSSELFGERSYCHQAHPSNFGRDVYYNMD